MTSPVVAVTIASSSVSRRIIDAQLEHESVQLRFRQRVRAFLLDRVLRRQHEERLRQRVRLTRRRDACSCIASSSAACVFGGARLISSASTTLAKIGPVREPERAVAGRLVLLEQLRAGDVARHEVGRELHARERQLERLRERLHQQRLGEPRHADEQRVAAREERGDEVVDDGAAAPRCAGRFAR